MNDAEIIARADANYVHAWRTIVASKDGGELVEGGGVVMANAGLPLAWFNIAFVVRPLVDPDASVRRIAQYFDERRLPFIIRIREGLDPATERAADAQGLPYTDTVPGLVLRKIPHLASVPSEIRITLIRDKASLQHHVDVVEQAFEMPPGFAQQIVSENLLTVPDVELYVGYVDGEPIASSALVASHRAAGVYNVGCLKSHRRRGYGEAMTSHALMRGAEQGCLMGSLQASEMGRAVYERMGFQVMAPYRTFARAGHGE